MHVHLCISKVVVEMIGTEDMTVTTERRIDVTEIMTATVTIEDIEEVEVAVMIERRTGDSERERETSD
jgi:hypothetical protein